MRSACLAIAFIAVLLASQGCGGEHRFGHPWDVPGPSAALVAEHARTHMPLVESLQRRQARVRGASPRGVAVPVGFRTYQDGVAIVEVLLYRPKAYPYWSSDAEDDLRRLKYFCYNGMTAFDAVDGVGYIIKRCDGRAVGLQTQDVSNPPDAATRERYGIIPDLVAPAVDMTAEGAPFVPKYCL